MCQRRSVSDGGGAKWDAARPPGDLQSGRSLHRSAPHLAATWHRSTILRLAGGVIDHGGATCEHGGGEDVFGGADLRKSTKSRATELRASAGVAVLVLIVPQPRQIQQMHPRTRPDGITTEGNLGTSATGQQRADTDRATDLLRTRSCGASRNLEP